MKECVKVKYTVLCMHCFGSNAFSQCSGSEFFLPDQVMDPELDLNLSKMSKIISN
jgi:hypothetical protein